MMYVYILTNWNNHVMYVGVTNNLERRMYEHRNNLLKGFTSRYNVHKLVYYECTESPEAAIEREKQIKGWARWKKDELVKINNPDFIELWQDSSSVSPPRNDTSSGSK